MLVRLALLAAVCAACGSPSPDPSPSAPDSPAPESLTTEAPAPSPAPDPRYYSDAELAAEGLRVLPQDALPTREMFGPDGPTPPIEGYDFLCQGDPDGPRCVCRRPLPCGEDDDCITYERNIATFREALADPDINVYCEHAEIGRCGSWRYFYFQGGIHRYEMRFFDESGGLVAQQNSTDYNAYCNHSAGVQWMGQVPRCEALEREEVICGEARRPLRAPLADLLGFTRASRPHRID